VYRKKIMTGTSIANAAARRAEETASTARPFAWIVLGMALSLLASGGRWNVALAAWIAPILLLRFYRSGKAGTAIAAMIAISCLQIAWWNLETGVPPSPTSAALTIAVGLLYAIPFVLDRLVGPRLGSWERILLLPTAMAATEFAVGAILPVGTSIGMRAITQSENLALLQIISVTGPYVVGFLIGCAATIANHIWEARTPQALVHKGGLFASILLAIVAAGQLRLTFGADIGGPTVKIAGITPPIGLRNAANGLVSVTNFPPSAGARAATRTPAARAANMRILDGLLADTSKAAKAGARMVIWSETAAPVTAEDKPALLRRAAALAIDERIYINAAVGVPFERNETFLIAPDGKIQWHYRKNHPVPGMEPVAPFANAPPLVDTPFGILSNIICFDGDFPALARIDADILIVPAWDWPEIAIAHTMHMARLRAIENGYSLVRVDFNGASAVFDPMGRIVARQDTTTDGAHMMIADVQVSGTPTLYGRVGDLFAWLCVFLSGALVVPAARRRA
jgi:apolipoprotein N-acyltransferase